MNLGLVTALLLLAGSSAMAQTTPTLDRNCRDKSNQQVVCPADVAKAISTRANHTNGVLTNPAITGGSITGVDVSGAPATASGALSSRSLSSRAADMLTPADFLSSGQTEASLRGEGMDAAPSITQALAKGAAFLPCGRYRLDTPIVYPSTPALLQGMSPACVTVAINFAAGDVVTSSSTSRSEIANVVFAGRVPRTSGAVVKLTGTYGFTLRNVGFDGYRFQDIVLNGANTTKILDGDHRPGTSDVCVTLTGTSVQAVDTFIRATNLAGCRIGLHLDNASGVYLSDMDILASQTNAVLINPAASLNQNVNAVRARNILADTTVGGAGFLITGDGPVSEIHLESAWASGSGQTANGTFPTPYPGLLANNPNLDGMTLANFYGHHNAGQAIDIEAGQHIKLTSPMACMNGVTASNQYDGIVVGEGVSFITISDHTVGECGFMKRVAGFTNQQRYGLFVNNTTNQFISIIGGQYMANLSGTLAVNVTDPNLTMSGNAPGCPSFTGTGAPITPAAPCATYRRTDGGTGTSFYVKESRTDGLGWVPK